MLKKIGIALATMVAAMSTVYLFIIRPWHVRWGATDEEVHQPMPGDDEVPHSLMTGTRAVTIRARPEEIWPWLVQIGTGRAGWYSFDWIENQMGLNVKSAKEILPELQHLAVGDSIPLGPGIGIPVKTIEPSHFLLLVGHDPAFGDISWVFALDPLDETHTRLVSRSRVRWPLNRGGIFWLIVTDPGSFIMMRQMLLGIKQRVEQTGKQVSDQTKDMAGSEE